MNIVDRIKRKIKNVNDAKEQELDNLENEYKKIPKKVAKNLYPIAEKYFKDNVSYIEKCKTKEELSAVQFVVYFDLNGYDPRITFPGYAHNFEKDFIEATNALKKSYEFKGWNTRSNEIELKVFKDILWEVCMCCNSINFISAHHEIINNNCFIVFRLRI